MELCIPELLNHQRIKAFSFLALVAQEKQPGLRKTSNKLKSPQVHYIELAALFRAANLLYICCPTDIIVC